MASTSKDIPVRIAIKYEDNQGLSESEIEMKTDFNEKLHDYFLSTRNSETCSLKSKNYLDSFILSIKSEDEIARQDSSYINDNRDKFKIIESKDGKERLLIKGEDGKYKMCLPWEDTFDIFWKTHIKYCHPTTETLKHILQDDYIIDDTALRNIREVCYTCSGIKKPYFRLALDLLPMTGSSDYAFTHIMTCQDIFTGFIHLRPLSVDNESEICVELLRIFMDFGPPKEVVISNNIFEVALDQFKHLTTFAPIPLIAITKVNPDMDKLSRIRNRITVWMKKNNFENWAIACYGVQLHLNKESKGRKKSPYASVFKKIESRVIESLPRMDVQMDKGVTTTPPVDSNAICCLSSIESAEPASPVSSSSEEGEALPEMDERIDDEVTTTSPVHYNAIGCMPGKKSAVPTSPGTSSSEEEQLITDETITGIETEFNANSDDEMVEFEDNDPLALDETFNL